jgi:hypothetical protein
MPFRGHCWNVTYTPWLLREATGYKESIPWNRCLGFLKSFKIRAQGVRSEKTVNIFEPLHLFCQYTHLPLKILTLTFSVDNFSLLIYQKSNFYTDPYSTPCHVWRRVFSAPMDRNFTEQRGNIQLHGVEHFMHKAVGYNFRGDRWHYILQ